MNWFIRMAMTAAVSLGIALLISLLAPLDAERRDPVTTLNPAEPFPSEPVFFTDGNLVDYLSRLALYTEIRRVRLSYSVLSVDLASQPDTTADAIYHDLAVLSGFSFDETANMKHLLVRVVLPDVRKGEVLLLAATGSRNRWENLKTSAGGSSDWKSLFDMHYIMKYTGAWEQHVENVAKW